jgi:hypothetical protein
MRELANKKIQAAKDTAENDNSQKNITIICDFSQNDTQPSYASEQPGETYFYVPLTVNIFGIVGYNNGGQEKITCYCYK